MFKKFYENFIPFENFKKPGIFGEFGKQCHIVMFSIKQFAMISQRKKKSNSRSWNDKPNFRFMSSLVYLKHLFLKNNNR